MYTLESCAIFSSRNKVAFILKIPSEFGTYTLCEPDSETLTNDIRLQVGYGDSIIKHSEPGGRDPKNKLIYEGGAPLT